MSVENDQSRLRFCVRYSDRKKDLLLTGYQGSPTVSRSHSDASQNTQRECPFSQLNQTHPSLTFTHRQIRETMKTAPYLPSFCDT